MRKSCRLASSPAWKEEARSIPCVLRERHSLGKGDFVSKFHVPLIMPRVYFSFHLLSSNLAVIQDLVSCPRLL